MGWYRLLSLSVYFYFDSMAPPSWLEVLSSSVFSYVNFVALMVFLFVYYLVSLYQRGRVFSNIPPGPKPWPVVGNFGGFLIPSFFRSRFGLGSEGTAKNAAHVLSELAKVYGDVYSIFVGSQLIVVLNTYEVVRDALLNHSDVFSDRPDIPTITIMTKRKGKGHFITV